MTKAKPRRLRRERGAMLVEAAFALPILLFVIMGAIEAGVAWDTKAGTTNALRSGLLRAASIGDKPETDLRILQSVIGEIGADRVGQIRGVAIFDAEANSGNLATTIATCAGTWNGPDGGTPDECVFYSNATLAEIAALSDASVYQTTHFDDGVTGASGTTYDCDQTKKDADFCARGRTNGGDIKIGVAISYEHNWLTGVFPIDAPIMNEVGVSSTFIADGKEISATNNATAGEQNIWNSGGFENGINGNGVSWYGVDENTDVASVISGSRGNYLGQFGQGEVITLNVDNLPAHNVVCVEFDLYIIGSWDSSGNFPTDPNSNGPDKFQVDIERDGTNDYDAVFGQQQTSHSDGNAVEQEDLGTSNFGFQDMVFTRKVCLEGHTDPSVAIDFKAVLSHPDISNESWGIDNVNVTTAWSV